MLFVEMPGLCCFSQAQNYTLDLDTADCSAWDIDGALVASRAVHRCVGENGTTSVDGRQGSNTLANESNSRQVL